MGAIARQNPNALISTRRFCPIEGGISELDYFFHANRFVGGTTPGERRPADRAGLPHLNPVVEIKGFRSHHIQDSFAEGWSARGVGGTGHNQKFFSTPSHQNVGLANYAP